MKRLFCFKKLFCLIVVLACNISFHFAIAEDHKDKPDIATTDAADGFLKAISSSNQTQCMSGVKYSQGNKATVHVGKMPPGYFYGMMLSFGQNNCADQNKNASSPFQKVLTTQSDASPVRLDTLKFYNNVVKPPDDPLLENYSLLLSLGMLESGGKYDEGRDKSHSNTTALTAEAGLFQVSYNSVNRYQVSPEIYKALMEKYQNGHGPGCMSGLFDVRNRHSTNTASWGVGAGQEFQNAMKSCPALAVDYMAVLLRKDYRHNGPLLRKEAKPQEACVGALKEMEEYSKNAVNCSKLNELAKSLAGNNAALARVGSDTENDGGSFSRKSVGRYYYQLQEQNNYLKKLKELNENQKLELKESENRIQELKTNNPDLAQEQISTLEATIKSEPDSIKQAETEATALRTAANQLPAGDKGYDAAKTKADEAEENVRKMKAELDADTKELGELKKSSAPAPSPEADVSAQIKVINAQIDTYLKAHTNVTKKNPDHDLQILMDKLKVLEDKLKAPPPAQ